MSIQYSILLVDDDPLIADVLIRASQQVFPEAEFTYLSSFDQAVAHFDSLNGPGPRLILLDLDLQSEHGGMDFLKLMRNHPQGRYLPIVILSASRDPKKMEEAYRQGATAFTVKPFSYQDWKSYASQLQNYWFGMASLPVIWFGDQTKASRMNP
ncbi:response regulator [Larkinella insperata]|uniref:Response regulator n=1 Tax=Larkinella insperata TaxID=332158 RepID=A0ABW3QAX4_9BACT|nr:response regulator [Larkinella insperata]